MAYIDFTKPTWFESSIRAKAEEGMKDIAL